MAGYHTMPDIPKPKEKGKRIFKIKRKCRGCGKRFVIKHKLRRYCDKCKGKGLGNTHLMSDAELLRGVSSE